VNRPSWKLRLLPWAYRLVATAILATCRVVFLGRERVEALERAGRTWVFVAWHETTGASVALERNQRLAMMASDSRDGASRSSATSRCAGRRRREGPRR
jgi:lysophospholipid acyltransferase (LPLAT)-like uncharacterized protein